MRRGWWIIVGQEQWFFLLNPRGWFLERDLVEFWINNYFFSAARLRSRGCRDLACWSIDDKTGGIISEEFCQGYLCNWNLGHYHMYHNICPNLELLDEVLFMVDEDHPLVRTHVHIYGICMTQ